MEIFLLDTAAQYAVFGEDAGEESPVFRDWALSIAEDADVLALIQTLPKLKQQPNLVLAAARWHGVPPGPYAALRSALLRDWETLRATVMQRATQTNEVGRCATLLPLLASLPGPLALLEVGPSAGLCLYPDRYSYRYSDGTSLDPDDGPSGVVLSCDITGEPPLPARLPPVVWRAGIDLNPLDAQDDDAMAWLENLVWPGQDVRRERLAAAIGIAREDPPHLVRGDLNTGLAALMDQAPSDATLVVFHSAVLAYLEEPDRERFAASMAERVAGGAHWISNEGRSVLPEIAATAPAEDLSEVTLSNKFVLGIDGRAVALTHGHGRSLVWL